MMPNWRWSCGIAVCWGAALSACAAPPARIDDRAAIFDRSIITRYDEYLAAVERESGVDVRFLFVRSVPEGTLEALAVREARSRGIGREVDRRSVLFVYDVDGQRLRIEVGPTLQDVFTDRFVGYLMRDHVRSFFAADDPELGFRLTLFMLHARLRRATLGEQYDPRAVAFITEPRRLATGGGATAAMRGGTAAAVSRRATPEARRRFGPQPTVEQTYARYLEWLRGAQFETDVELFTRASQGYLSQLPLSPAFSDYILFLEYGRAHEIRRHGDRALLVFTDDPLISPHFFRHTAAGWQMDLFAEVRNTREWVGAPWTWSLVLREDDFTHAFVHQYVRFGGVLRLQGGDNRPIATGAEALQPTVTPESTFIERLTVTEASQRIAARRGRPTVVLLYSTWSKNVDRLFPAIVAFLRRCEAAGLDVLAFSSDDHPQAMLDLSRFLRKHDAPFGAVLLHAWAPGELGAAMAPHGIRVGEFWRPPLIAVLDRNGRAMAQDQAIVSRGPELAIDAVAAALQQLDLTRSR